MLSCDLVTAASLKHWHKLELRTEKGKTLIANLMQVKYVGRISSLLKEDSSVITFKIRYGANIFLVAPRARSQ